MNIADFDVEPAVGPRWWAWVLGVLGAVTGVLAVIGWPVPHVSGRVGGRQAWEHTVHDADAWLAHDGWRTSGDSWVWGALATAATCGAVALLLPTWSDTRRWAIAAVPAGVLLVVGPVAQWALGLPWSDYDGGSTGDSALAIVIVVALAGMGLVLRRVVRRAGRRVDRRAVRRGDRRDLPPDEGDALPRHRIR